MVDRIRKFQILNDQIFTILEKYLQVSEDSTKSNGNQMEITYFEPPKMEASENGVPPVVGGEERIYQEVDQQAANMDGSTEGNMEERQYAEVGSVYIDDFEDDDAPEGPQSYVWKTESLRNFIPFFHLLCNTLFHIIKFIYAENVFYFGYYKFTMFAGFSTSLKMVKPFSVFVLMPIGQ